MADGDQATRIALARDPNWTESDPQDPMSEWYTWQQPNGWTKDYHMEVDGQDLHLGTDTKHLTRSAADYVGGTVWTEWGIVMGSPYPARIRAYDPKQKAVAFGGPWTWSGSERIIAGNRYYLEDMPQWLDSPGEFWFDKMGAGGRLYVRLPGDRDPNTVTLEAGRYVTLIDATDLSHFEISGLTFRFTNTPWQYDIPQWADPALRAGVFRLTGSGDDLVIRNNRFEDVNMPVRITAVQDGGHVGTVVISDNLVRYTDQGAFHVVNEEGKTVDSPRGRLDNVQILRNSLYRIGWRVLEGAHGHAISVQAVTRAHVAGNMLDRVAGWGISVSGGKRHPGADVPFVRSLVHHNRVKDCLLKSCDWGAFYITQGGPQYVYDNVAINPVGQMHWAGKRLGYAYYLDGGYKCYVFNNIAVGYDAPKGSPLRNTAAIQSMISFLNAIFDNTVYRFKQGAHRQSPQGGRELYLGNIFDDIGDWVFCQAKPAGSPAAANAAHVPPDKGHYPYETNAFSRNVLYDVTDEVGVFEANGMPYSGLDAFTRALAREGAMASDVGVLARKAPLRRPADGDFRAAPGSAAIGNGVKVFVPWSLSGVVGEWSFTMDRRDPAHILDEHWYMTSAYVDRTMYRDAPRYDLKALNVSADDYVQGPLEDWTRGALRLNGRDQYAVLPEETIAAPFSYQVPTAKGKTEKRTIAGRDKKTVDIDRGNFLIEAYFRTQSGTGGTLVSKMDSDAGYQLRLNEAGAPMLLLRAGGSDRRVAADVVVNDGRWHHLIAECDRAHGRVTLYVDGRTSTQADAGLAPTASLANGGDFLVGRAPDGDYLACTVDFLRVARGTLADAQTSIDELYQWEFSGPQYRDFAGRQPVEGRDAGAVESTE